MASNTNSERGKGINVALRLLTIVCTVGLLFIATVGTVEAEKEIPMTKFGQNVGGPTITFLYCYSCGYRKAFEDYSFILVEKYPEISIRGANYDPPGLNLYFSRAVLVLKLLLIFLIFSSFNVFGSLGLPTPIWWRFCLENKIFSSIMIFFVGNVFEAQLISSGAFEISLNDVPVWSKLQTGRIPVPTELFQIIDSHLHLNNNKMIDNPNYVK